MQLIKAAGSWSVSDDVDSGTFNADTWSLETTLARVGVYKTSALFSLYVMIDAKDNTVHRIVIGWYEPFSHITYILFLWLFPSCRVAGMTDDFSSPVGVHDCSIIYNYTSRINRFHICCKLIWHSKRMWRIFISTRYLE